MGKMLILRGCSYTAPSAPGDDPGTSLPNYSLVGDCQNSGTLEAIGVGGGFMLPFPMPSEYYGYKVERIRLIGVAGTISVVKANNIPANLATDWSTLGDVQVVERLTVVDGYNDIRLSNPITLAAGMSVGLLVNTGDTGSFKYRMNNTPNWGQILFRVIEHDWKKFTAHNSNFQLCLRQSNN